MIVCHNTLHVFNTNKTIYFGSYCFKKNTIYCICGPSGCGKSTFLAMLADVISNKTIVHNFPTKDYIYIPQRPLLPSFVSLKDSLDLQKRWYYESDFSVVDFYAKSFSLDCFLYPEQLSGGQLYRSALLVNAIRWQKVLICDEPFAHQDVNSAHAIVDYFVSFMQKTNGIIIFASHAQEVLCLLQEKNNVEIINLL